MIALALKFVPEYDDKVSTFKRVTQDIYSLNKYLKSRRVALLDIIQLLHYELNTKCRYSFIQRIYARYSVVVRIIDKRELEELYNSHARD